MSRFRSSASAASPPALDAAEFIIAGATAVQAGTANFWDPAAIPRITRELDQFLAAEGIPHVSSLRGTLKLKEDSQ